jgi:hypothetical protein
MIAKKVWAVSAIGIAAIVTDAGRGRAGERHRRDEFGRPGRSLLRDNHERGPPCAI